MPQPHARFGPEERLARIRVWLRRIGSDDHGESGRVTVGDLTIDYDRRRLLRDDANAAPTEPPAEGQPAPPPQMVPVPRSVAQDRWEHMRTTVINMQHLINELRPKQVSVCGAPTRVGRLC